MADRDEWKNGVPDAEQLKDMRYNVVKLERHLKQLIKTSEDLYKAREELYVKEQQWILDMLDFNLHHGCKDKHAAHMLTSTFKTVTHHAHLMAKETNDTVTLPLKQYLQIEVNTSLEMQRKYELAKERYLTATSKFQNMSHKADVTHFTKCETEMNEAKHDHDLMYFNSMAKMMEVENTKVVNLHERFFIFYNTYAKFVQRANELFQHIEPDMATWQQELVQDRQKVKQLAAESDDKLASGVMKLQHQPILPTEAEQGAVRLNDKGEPLVAEKQGYLFRKGSSAKGGWKCAWFALQDGILLYYKHPKDVSPEGALNLLICTVKATDRVGTGMGIGIGIGIGIGGPFSEKGSNAGGGGGSGSNASGSGLYCFEVISPDERYILRATTETDFGEWLDVLRLGIASQLAHNTPGGSPLVGKRNALGSTGVGWGSGGGGGGGGGIGGGGGVGVGVGVGGEEEMSLRDELWIVPGNDRCADCGQKDPEWAALNLGIVICVKCSGIHRSLGVHISKVRSLELDKWEPQQAGLMKSIGNKTSNDLWEGSVPEAWQTKRASPETETKQKEFWIRAKYAEKLFLSREKATLPEDESWHKKLRDAAITGRHAEILQCLAYGADINWQDPDDGNSAAIHAVVRSCGDLVSIELILQNGGEVNIRDARKRTPLHYAAECNRPDCCRLLKARGASMAIEDADGNTPAKIAEAMSHTECMRFLVVGGLTLDGGGSEFGRGSWIDFGSGDGIKTMPAMLGSGGRSRMEGVSAPEIGTNFHSPSRDGPSSLLSLTTSALPSVTLGGKRKKKKGKGKGHKQKKSPRLLTKIKDQVKGQIKDRRKKAITISSPTPSPIQFELVNGSFGSTISMAPLTSPSAGSASPTTSSASSSLSSSTATGPSATASTPEEGRRAISTPAAAVAPDVRILSEADLAESGSSGPPTESEEEEDEASSSSTTEDEWDEEVQPPVGSSTGSGGHRELKARILLKHQDSSPSAMVRERKKKQDSDKFRSTSMGPTALNTLRLDHASPSSSPGQGSNPPTTPEVQSPKSLPNSPGSSPVGPAPSGPKVMPPKRPVTPSPLVPPSTHMRRGHETADQLIARNGGTSSTTATDAPFPASTSPPGPLQTTTEESDRTSAQVAAVTSPRTTKPKKQKGPRPSSYHQTFGRQLKGKGGGLLDKWVPGKTSNSGSGIGPAAQTVGAGVGAAQGVAGGTAARSLLSASGDHRMVQPTATPNTKPEGNGDAS